MDGVTDRSWRKIVRAATNLVGRPHHLSLHPGGVVITPGPLTDVVPVQWTPKGYLATQFGHRDLESLGLPKIDVLGVRALTVLSDAARLIRQYFQPDFRLADIPIPSTKIESQPWLRTPMSRFQGSRYESEQKRMKVLSVVGARPQFIKAAPVSEAIRARHDEILVHTGQHYDDDLSAIFFNELGVPEPDYNLGVGSGTHGWQTAQMLIGLEQVLLAEEPDLVMVYGDTNSTLAGALAATKLNIPVAHVEAGLRSFNWAMPEEVNRVVTDRCSQVLFCPTETARENLSQEGIKTGVHVTGDVMYDAALYYAPRAEKESAILKRLSLPCQGYTLATVHRAENCDNSKRLRSIFAGLKTAAENLPVVLPLHPRTKRALVKNGLLDEATRYFRLIEPIGYLDMVKLEKNARRIATDSGGVQKEAYFFKVPCITLRTETEWVELTESGWNRLASPDSENDIANKILTAIKPADEDRMLFGDGNAAGKIVKRITAWPNELS